MRKFARAQDDIRKKLFPRVALGGLKWENKMYKLKRSIGYNIEFADLVYTRLDIWDSQEFRDSHIFFK